MICPKCQSKVINKQGVSKAGNPYNGNFCENKKCDYKEWLEAEPQPDRHEEIMGALRHIFELLQEIKNQPEEHIKEGEPEINDEQ